MHFTNNKKKLCNENYSVMKNGVTTLLYPIKFNESTKSFKGFKPRRPIEQINVSFCVLKHLQQKREFLLQHNLNTKWNVNIWIFPSSET